MVEQDCALNGHKATEAFVGLEQSAVVDEDRGGQCCGLCRQFLLHGPQDVPCMSGGGPRGWGGPPPQAPGWSWCLQAVLSTPLRIWAAFSGCGVSGRGREEWKELGQTGVQQRTGAVSLVLSGPGAHHCDTGRPRGQSQGKAEPGSHLL